MTLCRGPLEHHIFGVLKKIAIIKIKLNRNIEKKKKEKKREEEKKWMSKYFLHRKEELMNNKKINIIIEIKEGLCKVL